MIIFELLVNDELVARAGAEDLSVLSSTISARGVLGGESLGIDSVKDGYRLEASLTGLTSRSLEPKNRHVGWYSSRALKIGDELRLRIVEGTEASEPLVLGVSES